MAFAKLNELKNPTELLPGVKLPLDELNKVNQFRKLSIVSRRMFVSFEIAKSK